MEHLPLQTASLTLTAITASDQSLLYRMRMNYLTMRGVTGLEAEPFCNFAEEFDGEIGPAHTGTHKI